MSELATEYEGRVQFQVVSAEETQRRAEEVATYGFGGLRHGLVGFDREGQVRLTLPGHDYGEPEIRAAIETLLAADRP